MNRRVLRSASSSSKSVVASWRYFLLVCWQLWPVLTASLRPRRVGSRSMTPSYTFSFSLLTYRSTRWLASASVKRGSLLDGGSPSSELTMESDRLAAPRTISMPSPWTNECVSRTEAAVFFTKKEIVYQNKAVRKKQRRLLAQHNQSAVLSLPSRINNIYSFFLKQSVLIRRRRFYSCND